MGRKSISGRALAHKQRHNHTKVRPLYEKDEDGNTIDKNISQTSKQCEFCGFKAFYEFIRCPSCERV